MTTDPESIERDVYALWPVGRMVVRWVPRADGVLIRMQRSARKRLDSAWEQLCVRHAGLHETHRGAR